MKYFLIFMLFFLKSTAQSASYDTIFVKNLGLKNVVNIDSFEDRLMIRKNDSIYFLENEALVFNSIEKENYTFISYDANNKPKLYNYTVFPHEKNNHTEIMGRLFPGEIDQMSSYASIGNKLYITYNGDVLEYQLNKNYYHFLKGISVRSVNLHNYKLYVGTYDSLYVGDNSNDVWFINERKTAPAYTNGYINVIQDKVYINSDFLYEVRGDSSVIVDKSSDFGYFRKLIEHNCFGFITF